MKFWKYQLGTLLAVLILLSPSAMAQLTSGNITGSILDPTGAVVPGATIVARNTATGVETTATSTSKGDYRFENLPVGTYNITANAQGFSKTEIANIAVVLNETVTANVTLSVGQSTTSVEVTEAAVSIDTTTAQVQTTFDTKEVADLPSASGGQGGSGLINISLLAAGVTSSGGAGYGTGPSVGGQRPTNNNFTIEGIDNNSLSVTGPVVTVPNDAVAEFSMLQNQFSPDFGHSSGGQFNEVVKSGTNEFHGELYEYLENRDLNAADNLNFVQGNPLHPRSDNNRFGGNFGGPIKRNKLFFFADLEYNPIGGVASTAYYAPTAAGYATLAGFPVNQTNLAEFRKYLGTAAAPNGPTVMVAPTAGSNENLMTGVFAAGGVGGISIPTGLVSAALPSYENNDFGVGSVDYNISDKDSLRGRFIMNRIGAIDTSGYPAAFFDTEVINSYIATLSEYHTFTPSLINEFRIGYNRQNQDFPVGGAQSFPGLDQFPNIDVLELSAGYGPDPNAPQYTIQNLYQLTDNITWTKGNHSFKFGFDGWSSISPSSFTQRSRGDYEWTYLNDYLYDTTPDYVAERGLGNVTYYQNQQLLGFYGNDNWKVTPNLTVNLGLRYEYLTIPLGEQSQDLNSSASVPGLISFQTPSTQKNAFMPRIGIAYSPGNSGKTSIRAGFGISYDVLYDNLGTLSLPPQLSSTFDVQNSGATGFLANGGISPSSQVAAPQGAEARYDTSGYIPNQQRPETYNWNFGIQHVFADKYVFDTRYVGTHSIYLPVQVQLNIQPVVNVSNALPVYTTMPSQATLNSLPNTLAGLENQFDNGNGGNGGFLVPAYANAGFTGNIITAFMPEGNSIYHGWSNELSRRFSNGLQFRGSYTWSHDIDDSTDALDSTVLSPRRPQNSQDLSAERASSLLDHRNRIILEMIYDVPYFKNRNWFMKNVIGNWEVSPVYTFQSGELVTAQSAIDANLNADSADDRVIVNPAGNPSVGSDTTALTNSAGDTVAYLANNPNARYITAPSGTFPNGGRNTLQLNPIDDVDLTLVKRFSLTERFHLEFAARAFNIFNHPQYTGGFINDVAPVANGGAGDLTGDIERPALEPGSAIFQQWSQAFSSNPRAMQLSLKLIF